MSPHPPEPRVNLPFVGVPTFYRSPHIALEDDFSADVAVLGVPSDEGSPWYPGSRMAPRTIREMSMRYAEYGPGGARAGFYDIDQDRRLMSDRRIVDCGDVDIVYTNPLRTLDNTTASVRRILERGALPLVFGGDHAVSWGVVRAFTEKVNVLHLDAHVDFRPFVHGAEYGNGSPIRRMSMLPHIDQVVQVGMRSIRTSESDLAEAREAGNDVISMQQFRRDGAARVVENLPAGAPLYISIDIDVLDMPLVPGCASAEPEGFGYAELRDLLAQVTAHCRLIGLDVVEVNPMIDVPSNNTSLLAAQLGLETLGRATL